MINTEENENEQVENEIEMQEKQRILEHKITLQDNLKTIINDDISKDVTFIVGDPKKTSPKEIHAHKAILASRK